MVACAKGEHIFYMNHKQKIIAIVGPTASGKTALGVVLAREFGGEVISADSRQIYRDMDMIAGVPTVKEMRGVPHHLLRVASPKAIFSAGRFTREGTRAIAQIVKRGHLPIVVGGTGFYAETLLGKMVLPEVPPNKKLRAELAKKSAAELFEMLEKLDSRRAGGIDAQNPVRLIRAIEIAKALGAVPELSGDPQSPFDVFWLGVSPAAEGLEEKIRARILARLKRGMAAEAARLREIISKKRFNELGAEFSLLADHLDQKLTRIELIDKLTQWELKYIKRQLRWHKRNKDIVWVSDAATAIEETKDFLGR